jgi:D-serine deaminase-like pyridoxal phosphate-dependent protein
LRIPALIERAMRIGGTDVMRGLMCYSVEEARFLSDVLPADLFAPPPGHLSSPSLSSGGFVSDLLVAYPAANMESGALATAWRMAFEGTAVTLMVDSTAQVDRIVAFVQAAQSAFEEEQRRTDRLPANGVERKLRFDEEDATPPPHTSRGVSIRGHAATRAVVGAAPRAAPLERGYGRQRPIRLRLAIDMDVSYEPFAGGAVHLGVHRSPIRSLSALQALVERIVDRPDARASVVLAGLMGYEAHIAGLTDADPRQPRALHWALRGFKWLATRQVRARRAEAAAYLAARGLLRTPLAFRQPANDWDDDAEGGGGPFWLNGGGTGSLPGTAEEGAQAASARAAGLTEVTVGSGLLQSQLFDYYASTQSASLGLSGALAFALSISRVPQPDAVTCHSGTDRGTCAVMRSADAAGPGR